MNVSSPRPAGERRGANQVFQKRDVGLHPADAELAQRPIGPPDRFLDASVDPDVRQTFTSSESKYGVMTAPPNPLPPSRRMLNPPGERYVVIRP